MRGPTPHWHVKEPEGGDFGLKLERNIEARHKSQEDFGFSEESVNLGRILRLVRRS